jgi:hypothetical protein
MSDECDGAEHHRTAPPDTFGRIASRGDVLGLGQTPDQPTQLSSSGLGRVASLTATVTTASTTKAATAPQKSADSGEPRSSGPREWRKWTAIAASVPEASPQKPAHGSAPGQRRGLALRSSKGGRRRRARSGSAITGGHEPLLKVVKQAGTYRPAGQGEPRPRLPLLVVGGRSDRRHGLSRVGRQCSGTTDSCSCSSCWRSARGLSMLCLEEAGERVLSRS